MQHQVGILSFICKYHAFYNKLA